jgi:hypothetical protein
MLEASISVAIAALTGLTFVIRRIDAIELKMAEKYITRTEVTESFKRFEDHFVRIEDKLDNLRQNYDS